MELCTKDGKPKILNKCTFPLTGLRCVDYIVTEYGVIEVRKQRPLATEIAPGHTPEEIQGTCIEPKLHIDENLSLMYEE